jgi:hypothetical protein
MLNIFSLHGKYFQNDENRLTANFLFLLSENRQTFLDGFLKRLGYSFNTDALARAEINFQVPRSEEMFSVIPDAEIKIHEHLHLLIEAKVGTNRLNLNQVDTYSKILTQSPSKDKMIVCITQINELKEFNEIIRKCCLPKKSYAYLQWHEVITLLKEELSLGYEEIDALERRLVYGRNVIYSKRIASLFLDELENTMYDKKVINELKVGDIPDITVTTQDPWFMNVALDFYIWFPSGATQYGLQPTKYVAYYETGKSGNKNPKTISYIARNLIYWNRITLSEARQLGELKPLFKNEEINKEISSWYSDEDTFHIALTEAPIKLAQPLKLKKSNYARVLSKRKYSFAEFIAATSIDDLF